MERTPDAKLLRKMIGLATPAADGTGGPGALPGAATEVVGIFPNEDPIVRLDEWAVQRARAHLTLT